MKEQRIEIRRWAVEQAVKATPVNVDALVRLAGEVERFVLREFD